MSKTWKWILGIAIVMVVVAAFGFVAWNTFGFSRWSGRMSAYEPGYPHMMEEFEPGGRGFPCDEYDRHGHMPMMGGYGSFHSPMGGYGFMPMPFMFFGGLLRLVFPLGVLALVAYFAYQQGKKAGMQAAVAAPAPEQKSKGRGRKVAGKK